jgi:hypothetical protein
MVELNGSSSEYLQIAGRMKGEMGSANVLKIERCENKHLWMQYDLVRQKVAETKKAAARDNSINEQWFWHGTDALDLVLKNGFDSARYGNTEFNAYGVGAYFAPDAKLSDFFIRSARGGTTGEKKLLFCRVICGRIAEKEHLSRTSKSTGKSIPDLLKKPEHRGPPDGYDSIMGKGTNFELIVRDDRAYPAYVVTYTLDAALPDPNQQWARYLKKVKTTAGWKLTGK